MRYLTFCIGILIGVTIAPVQALAGQPDAIIIQMDLPLRIHSLPATQSDVVTVIPPGTGVSIVGRTRDGEWLQIDEPEGDTGWMMVEFADVLIDLQTVPVTTGLDRLPFEAIEFDPVVVKRLHKIFQAGQTIGNRAGVFSKVGDSITAAPHMLSPIGQGLYNLGDYQYLQGIIDHFSVTKAREDFTSFDNISLAAGIGWPAHAAVDARFADPDACETNELPLVCEYRLVRPSMALIMFGTNDLDHFTASVYRGNLQQIVKTSIDMGVIPILSTIPIRLGFEDKVNDFNAVVAETATRFSIPLWDFYTAMRGLPGEGLDVDGTHPSIPPRGFKGAADFRANNLYYGYVIRNLTALQMLDAVWRVVNT